MKNDLTVLPQSPVWAMTSIGLMLMPTYFNELKEKAPLILAERDDAVMESDEKEKEIGGLRTELALVKQQLEAARKLRKPGENAELATLQQKLEGAEYMWGEFKAATTAAEKEVKRYRDLSDTKEKGRKDALLELSETKAKLADGEISRGKLRTVLGDVTQERDLEAKKTRDLKELLHSVMNTAYGTFRAEVGNGRDSFNKWWYGLVIQRMETYNISPRAKRLSPYAESLLPLTKKHCMVAAELFNKESDDKAEARRVQSLEYHRRHRGGPGP